MERTVPLKNARAITLKMMLDEKVEVNKGRGGVMLARDWVVSECQRMQANGARVVPVIRGMKCWIAREGSEVLMGQQKVEAI